jgi:large subunit ribosomal protein L18
VLAIRCISNRSQEIWWISGLTYVRTLKRIRQDKTNYSKRAALILGRSPFVTIKVSDQNIAGQLLKATPTGDVVVASSHSRELQKQGWKGTFNNLPACYLTGLLLGKKALEKGVKTAVLYVGKDKFTSRVAAALKGIIDSGIQVPVSEESLPSTDRISGQHIADYASSLKENEQDYNSRFSAILKAGLKPEDYPSHFEELRFKITGKKQSEFESTGAEDEEEEEEQMTEQSDKEMKGAAKEKKPSSKEGRDTSKAKSKSKSEKTTTKEKKKGKKGGSKSK